MFQLVCHSKVLSREAGVRPPAFLFVQLRASAQRRATSFACSESPHCFLIAVNDLLTALAATCRLYGGGMSLAREELQDRGLGKAYCHETASFASKPPSPKTNFGQVFRIT